MALVLCKGCNEEKDLDEIVIFLHKINSRDITESGKINLPQATEGVCIDCANNPMTCH